MPSVFWAAASSHISSEFSPFAHSAEGQIYLPSRRVQAGSTSGNMGSTQIERTRFRFIVVLLCKIRSLAAPWGNCRKLQPQACPFREPHSRASGSFPHVSWQIEIIWGSYFPSLSGTTAFIRRLHNLTYHLSQLHTQWAYYEGILLCIYRGDASSDLVALFCHITYPCWISERLCGLPLHLFFFTHTGALPPTRRSKAGQHFPRSGLTVFSNFQLH